MTPARPATTNPSDLLSIRNTLARYCVALDTKDFSLLDDVFLPSVRASYPFRPTMDNVDAVKEAIKGRLGPLTTQHALTTQTITFTSPTTASTTTYFTGYHFGQGPHEGEVLTAFGKYVDTFECIPVGSLASESVPGASGNWRIAERTVVFMKRIGNEKIMSEY